MNIDNDHEYISPIYDGLGHTPIFRLENGIAIGEIWALKLDERNPIIDGAYNFQDYDRDG